MSRISLCKLVGLATLTAATAFALPAQAAWVQIDNFETGFGFSGSPVTIASGTNGWNLTGSTAGPASSNTGLRQIMSDPLNPNNEVLAFLGGGGTGTDKSVTAGSGIADGTSGTIFMRFYMGNNTSVQFGMLNAATASTVTGTAGTVNFGTPTTANNTITGYVPPTPTATAMSALAPNTWYSLWIVLNNTTNTGADVVNFYLQGGAFASQTQLSSAGPNFNFTSRTNFGTGDANELVKLAFRPQSAHRASDNLQTDGGTLLVDDIYFDNGGQSLTNPVPEPSSIILLTFALSGVGLWKIRRMK